MSARHIKPEEALENAGFGDVEELMDDPASVPACCSEGCMVEPDGVCPHGFKSVLIEMGLC